MQLGQSSNFDTRKQGGWLTEMARVNGCLLGSDLEWEEEIKNDSGFSIPMIGNNTITLT
jgi:hypothetical protein